MPDAAVVEPIVSDKVVTPPPISVTPSTTVKASDLVKRSAEQTATLGSTPAKPDSAIESPKFNLEEIKDPVQRGIVEKKLKDLERGYNDKYMALAEQRKQTEDIRKQLESQTNQPWTPERVKSLMADQNFIQAGKLAVEELQKNKPPSNWEGTTDEWSALSDGEKQRFTNLENKVNTLLFQQTQMVDREEHSRIKTRFPDYDPSVVEQTQLGIIQNRISSEGIKEMIWKAVNFDKYVERSYQFGLQDRNGNLKEKIEGSTSPTAISVTSAEDVPKIQEGERPRNYFVRLAQWRLTQGKR